MSVFKRTGSPFYVVEFWYQNRRIRQSSGTTSVRQAEEFERQLRRRCHEQFVMGKPATVEMTIREAVERYITTHLKTKKRKAKTAKAQIFLLNALIERLGGDDILLSSLTTPVISQFKEKLIASGLQPASVNRYLAELKAILRRAKREWEVLPSVPTITLFPLDNDRMEWLRADFLHQNENAHGNCAVGVLVWHFSHEQHLR